MIRSTQHFSFEASYFVSHEPELDPEDLWIVFHGYGQLAEFFLRKFMPLANSHRLFLAPEGTNYFYLQDFKGRVGANWMTRYERELAIANNHRYLDALVGKYLEKFDSKPRIHILGFSQGAATATRWASQWGKKISTLVLWAGGFAEDMVLDVAREKFEKTKIYMVLGSEDNLITAESLERQEELIKKLGNPLERLEFRGGHELNFDLLRKIIENA
ncbi:alpha/beta hydrolase [Algoriphagus kandeliae]|uniref:Alpha/beta hydrolase n=1 Tax=Algoriphagus kandeliae TaxID=2562278 RepID=A0A4Y9QPJ0_9BACT|nr:dienelactone hydrolase family protein [Algoriphagus kandeliae]TFV93502.1 alpha/beta hydrolase [Algoriphagus kandeliae]